MMTTHRCKLNEKCPADRGSYLIEDTIVPNVAFSIPAHVSKEETQAELCVVLVTRHGPAEARFLYLRLSASLARSLARSHKYIFWKHEHCA